MNTGDRIKQRSLELGLSADELALRIGKSRATIYRYENGDIENMPTPILEPLAKALYTTPAQLMGWEMDDGDIGNALVADCLEKEIDNILFCLPTYPAAKFFLKVVKLIYICKYGKKDSIYS